MPKLISCTHPTLLAQEAAGLMLNTDLNTSYPGEKVAELASVIFPLLQLYGAKIL